MFHSVNTIVIIIVVDVSSTLTTPVLLLLTFHNSFKPYSTSVMYDTSTCIICIIVHTILADGAQN